MGPIAPKPGDITLESSLKGQEAPVTPRNDAQEADSLENQSPGINKFEYFEVNQADFRLLLLERDSKTPEIHCHLIPASFEENFRYEALSYTWGDPSAELRSVWINGNPFKVTSNLFSALQRLRTSLPSGEKYRFLWVDSLCIDQENNKDRNHQVSNMGKIYQQAALVLVWLGEQSQDSDQAIDFIEKVHALSKHKVSGHYTYHGSEHYTAPEWKAMDSLFRREYWERTWIIQEIQLAKNVLIHCGDGAFNWAAGGAFYDFLHSDRYLETDPGNITLKQSVMQSPAIQLLESTLVFQKRDMTLKQLLYRHEQSKCRESRD
jgi:Heterokaryon incompatibility protein (HET)